MQGNINGIINFYRDCYQHEFSREKVANFFSANVTHLYEPPSFQLLSQPEFIQPVDTIWGTKIATELKLESSEKKLVCGSFFLKGKVELLGKQHRIFTPLFINDVMLDKIDETYILKVDQESTSLNPIAVNYLNTLDEAFDHSFDDLSMSILNMDDLFTFDGTIKLRDLLRIKYPKLNLSSIENRLKTEDRLFQLETVYKSRKIENEAFVFPDLLVGVIEKPKKSKDVINELTELGSRSHQKNSLLSTVFTNAPISNRSIKGNQGFEIVVPVSLSPNQEKILKAAQQSTMTVVVGPPGTGKSFSIAALAIQLFHEGKKVLIASKNEQACQVIYGKIRKDIGIKDVTINASKARFRISVSSKLRNIANGIGVKAIRAEQLHKLRNEMVTYQSEALKLIEKIIERDILEKKWGSKLAIHPKGFLNKIQQHWIRYRHNLKNPIWVMKNQLHQLEKKLKLQKKNFIKLKYQNRLYQLLKSSRPELIKFEKAFQEKRGNVIRDIFSSVDFDTVLRALPIWVCKSNDIANIVPLKEGLFDVLIIDEASQCDIASSIPLIYRSKSIVIVGDPNQLRHISFLSNRMEQEIQKRFNVQDFDLGYRERSILDQVNENISTQEQIIFLDEHFRSRPEIINFSNTHFYADQLKVMTHNLNEGHHNHLLVHVIQNGKRNEKGENAREAKQVLSRIQEIIEQEQPIGKNECTTIGVISPFRSQVQMIKKLLKEHIEPKNISKHRILVGTPFHFQGEERDVVFLTFTIDENTSTGAIRYLEKPDVFNVSITRAKYFQEVYISIDPKKLNQNSLLVKYLTTKYEVPKEQFKSNVYDLFLTKVKTFLERLNPGKILIDKHIGGTKIDLVIVQENRTIGIDLIGFPGVYSRQLSMEEIKVLERAQIDIFLLPFSTWYLNKGMCERALKKFIKN